MYSVVAVVASVLTELKHVLIDVAIGIHPGLEFWVVAVTTGTYKTVF